MAVFKKFLEKDEAKQILDKKDWSASSDDFKLAYAVLTDDYEKAFELMIKIGDNGEVDKSDYKQWPYLIKYGQKRNSRKHSS